MGEQRTASSTLASSVAHRRRDIQGLRTIAVLMVVAFHAGLPVPGGFVGVDVFFVISGFVITAMLHREWATTGRIRFGRFYLRRFKRLTPALALVVAVTVLISAVVLSPLGQQQTVAKTGLGAMLLTANLVIAHTTGGYFDAPAETNPLLNTWSLSVEEQFYLVFPALIVLSWYFARRRGWLRFSPHLMVGAIAVISFALALANASGLTFRGSGMILGFYSPLTRAWEFAVGALLALALARWAPQAPRLMATLGAAGLLMLAASLWLITDTTPFPGPWTLLPVSGTLLLLLAGAFATNQISRILSTTPMVKIGDWSYSIYLWHWPLIVFAVYIWPVAPYAPIVAALAAMAPALASYRWVEQPIRSLPAEGKRRVAALISVVLVPPLFLSALVGASASRYWLPRYEAGTMPEAHQGDTDWTDFYTYLENTYYPCANTAIRDNALEWEGIKRCRQSKPDANVDVALVGDSHAEHLFLGLAEAFPETNIAFYILGTLPIEDGAGMSRIIHEVADDPATRTVIVNADWAERKVPAAELTDTLRTFTKAGKKVFVTDDVPVYPFDAKECKYSKSPWISISNCTQDLKRFQEAHSAYFPALQSAVQAVPGVELLIGTRYFCNDETCDMTHDGQLMYRDTNHLNNIGSRYVATQLVEDNASLKDALSGK